MLIDNTAALLAQFDEERHQELERLKAMRALLLVGRSSGLPAQLLPGISQPGKDRPWVWMAAGTSMGYFRLRDGSSWVRILHRDRRQILAPWPIFDGWEEALPIRLGLSDSELGGIALHDVIAAVRYLREQGAWDTVCGTWRELTEAARR